MSLIIRTELTESEVEYLILALQQEKELLISEVNTAKVVEQDAKKLYCGSMRHRRHLQFKLAAVEKFLKENVV